MFNGSVSTAPAQPVVSTTRTSLSRLAWTAAFTALIVLECLPAWTLRYFPSQDGPSHLYNAAILAGWNTQPLYQRFYEVHFTPAGNLLFQLLLAGMIRVMAPALIEALLLTAYVVLFALAFRSLFARAGPRAWAFSFFAYIFLANNFFHTGFWNFMFSIPLAMLALACYLRGPGRGAAWWLVRLALWGLAVYEMHMASWMALAIALGVLCAFAWWDRYRQGSPRAWSAFAPLVTLLPPMLLTLFFLTGSGYRSVSNDRIPETMLDRVKPLAALSFFRSLSDADLVFTALFGIWVVAMAASILRRRQRPVWLPRADDAWLLVALACAVASVTAPSAASGVFIRHRLAFYAWMFLVLWLSVQPWRPPVLRLTAATACLLAALPFFWRIPEYRRWERAIAEFASVDPYLPAGSTVLALDMQDTWHRINPLLHAVDLFAPKPFVDLRNYEASTAYFPTRFRPELSPFRSLGSVDDLQHIPPVFHLERYEQQIHSTVDYLLFYGPPREGGLYADQLRNYRPVYVSRPAASARLYRRVP